MVLKKTIFFVTWQEYTRQGNNPCVPGIMGRVTHECEKISSLADEILYDGLADVGQVDGMLWRNFGKGWLLRVAVAVGDYGRFWADVSVGGCGNNSTTLTWTVFVFEPLRHVNQQVIPTWKDPIARESAYVLKECRATAQDFPEMRVENINEMKDGVQQVGQ